MIIRIKIIHIIIPFTLLFLVVPKFVYGGKLKNLFDISDEEDNNTPTYSDLNIEEIVFNLAPRLQGLLSQYYAKKNFIISPMAAIVALAQILYGLNEKGCSHITDLLNVKYNLQSDNNGIFHFKLKGLINKSIFKDGSDKAMFTGAMFYKTNTTFEKYFVKYTKYVIHLDLIQTDFSSSKSSTTAIEKWGGGKNADADIAQSIKKLISTKTESLFLHNFLFCGTWKTPMKKSDLAEDFHLSPNKIVKVNYLEGILPRVQYARMPSFQLVSIPLSQKNIKVHILLPEESNDLLISQFAENLQSNYFQTILKSQMQERDVNVKIPDVFSQIINFDVIKPLLKFINEGREGGLKYLILNDTNKLKVNHLIHHGHLNITNDLSPEDNISLSEEITTTVKPRKPKVTKIPTTTIPPPSEETVESGETDLVTTESPDKDVIIDESGKTDFVITEKPENDVLITTKDIHAKSETNSTGNIILYPYPVALPILYPIIVQNLSDIPINFPSLKKNKKGKRKKGKNVGLTKDSIPAEYLNRNNLIEFTKSMPNLEEGNNLPSLVNFEVTRPFVFLMMNEVTEMVYVWGCISNPEKVQ